MMFGTLLHYDKVLYENEVTVTLTFESKTKRLFFVEDTFPENVYSYGPTCMIFDKKCIRTRRSAVFQNYVIVTLTFEFRSYILLILLTFAT